MVPPACGYLISFIALELLSAVHRCLFQRSSPIYPNDRVLSGKLSDGRSSRISNWFPEGAKVLRYKKNIQFQIPDLRFIEGQTNCFKKRSEKLFAFFKTFEKIYKLFF
jgi:hypothetical protein